MARVFIVDDDPSIVGLLRDLLEVDGHELTTYQSSVEALRVIQGHRFSLPELILLDIMMPEIDGFTFLNKLNESERTRSIPIIVLTARGQLADVFAPYQNVAGFLAKPFDLSALRALVGKSLARRT